MGERGRARERRKGGLESVSGIHPAHSRIAWHTGRVYPRDPSTEVSSGTWKTPRSSVRCPTIFQYLQYLRRKENQQRNFIHLKCLRTADKGY